jgi:hypothetical protein
MTRICLDLFAGLGGFSQAFKDADGWTVITVDKTETFERSLALDRFGAARMTVDAHHPQDIVADVLDLSPTDDRLPTNPDVVLASPPCHAFSCGGGGTDLDEDGHPVSAWGRTSLALVHHTVGLIQGLDPQWWVIENPMGGMRKDRILGRPDAHIWQCRYGSKCAKPTDLWGRIPRSFDARTCANGNRDCHHEPAERGAQSGTQSNDRTTPERSRIPRGLSAELYRSIENPSPEQTTLLEVTQ